MRVAAAAAAGGGGEGSREGGCGDSWATEAVGRRSEGGGSGGGGDGGSSDVSEGGGSDSGKARAAAASVEASAVAAAAAAAVAADGSSGGGSGCCGCGCGCGCGGGGGDAAVTVVMAAAVAEMAKMAAATMAASWAASVASKEVVAAAATAARAAAAAVEAARVARVTVVTATAAAVERTPTRVVGAPKELNHAALHSRCGPAAVQHCPARLARGCQRARLHLDRCDAGMGMGAGARRWNWLVTHNRAAFSTCAAGCGAPTENCWRCRPHSRDALRHTRPMEASLRPRGQSGERSAAACGSPSKSRRSRPCGHGKLGLQHAVAAPATEPPAATSNHGPRQPPSRTQPQRAWGRARSGTGTGIRPGGRSIHLLVPV